MIEIYGKGYEILAFFDIEYEKFIEKMAIELMSNPNKRFRLSLQRVPLKKTKAPKYIQPELARG